MLDVEIITQFKRLRSYEKEKLSNQLLPEYQEGLSNALKSINEIIKITWSKHNVAQNEYFDIRDRNFVSKTSKQNAYKLYNDLSFELSTSKDKKNVISMTFIATCERTLKLNEFDTETERIILAHICQIELICGNKKALLMIKD